jgi:hypothetical protein
MPQVLETSCIERVLRLCGRLTVRGRFVRKNGKIGIEVRFLVVVSFTELVVKRTIPEVPRKEAILMKVADDFVTSCLFSSSFCVLLTVFEMRRYRRPTITGKARQDQAPSHLFREAFLTVLREILESTSFSHSIIFLQPKYPIHDPTPRRPSEQSKSSILSGTVYKARGSRAKQNKAKQSVSAKLIYSK